MKPQTYIMIGRSGCGKGTQVELLMADLKAKEPNRAIYHLETGNKFREFIKTPGYTSSLAKEIGNAGGLQPEFLAIWNWSAQLIDNLKEDEHLILDGLCRRLYETLVLDRALEFYKRQNAIVIVINVSNDWAFKRLKARSRHDDTDAGIMSRLKWYDTEVVPSIEFFKKNSAYRVIEVNGEQSIEEVHADITKALEKGSGK